MNEISNINRQDVMRLEDKNNRLTKADLVTFANMASSIVDSVASCVDRTTQSYRDIEMIRAQVEVETKRLDHVMDCLMVKAQRDLQIYRDTLPLLDKNFEMMQSRMDRLMDRAMDLICDDISDESLSRQEAMMHLIEITNDTLNGLVMKLLPK